MRRIDPVLFDAGSPFRRREKRTSMLTPGMLRTARPSNALITRQARLSAASQC